MPDVRRRAVGHHPETQTSVAQFGGGQRIDNLALLEQRIAEHQLPREAFEWYLDLRRFGAVPHSGFGLGIERTVAWICGLDHIRESIPFPRMLHKMYP